MASLFDTIYNPDVLTCLANLSNDEVFTPPELANQVLDMLPEEIWSDPTIKILDPCCKSGVFLREAAKRFIEGLEDVYPNLQERVNHIMHEQLFGIAITEMTSLLSRRSLYCSKFADGKFSVSHFENPEGNIRFCNLQHTWVRGKCSYCGASEEVYRRDAALESHAYELIHTPSPERIFNMKFDVIVGNPPYHLSDGGNGKSAKPIYHLFIEQAQKLKPRYLTMIIPSRWFAGGKGLNNFRHAMLADKHVRELVDFENFKDVFPGVDVAGGVCYFLWNRDNPGLCKVTNATSNSRTTTVRELNEFPIFIRQNLAIGIVRKILSRNPGLKLDSRISSRKPFGIPTNYQPKSKGIPCWFVQKIGQKHASASDVSDPNGYLNKWKFLIPKSPIAGQTDFSKPVGFYYDGNTRIAKPGECCTESWLVAGAFSSEHEALNFKSYLFTKTVRFLLLQTVVSQDVTRKNFCFVPDMGSFDMTYSDEYLREIWDINDEEWRYIDSRIGTISGSGNRYMSAGKEGK